MLVYRSVSALDGIFFCFFILESLVALNKKTGDQYLISDSNFIGLVILVEFCLVSPLVLLPLVSNKSLLGCPRKLVKG